MTKLLVLLKFTFTYNSNRFFFKLNSLNLNEDLAYKNRAAQTFFLGGPKID